MAEPTAPRHPKNTDVECLRCGARNIPDNKICGRCGANLPLVYDEDGMVFNVKDRPNEPALGRTETPGGRMSTGNIRWVIRFSIVFFALLVAFWIMHHK